MEARDIEPAGLVVVADTGPLISALQSNSTPILAALFGTVLLSTTCLNELIEHGWGDELGRCGQGVVQVVSLTDAERGRAAEYALRVAGQQGCGDDEAKHHLGEAEAMVLAERGGVARTLVLLDESAARSVAQALGLNVSGFPGTLLAAARRGLITSDGVRQRLKSCQDQGTHYSGTLIERVYHGFRESGSSSPAHGWAMPLKRGLTDGREETGARARSRACGR